MLDDSLGPVPEGSVSSQGRVGLHGGLQLLAERRCCPLCPNPIREESHPPTKLNQYPSLGPFSQWSSVWHSPMKAGNVAGEPALKSITPCALSPDVEAWICAIAPACQCMTHSCPGHQAV
jgi:hypothetical protein